MTWVALVFIGFPLGRAYSCYSYPCSGSWRSDNNACDADCASELCGFDQRSISSASSAFDRLMSSDCVYKCMKVCSQAQLSNAVCDSNCNVPECGYDAGTCGYCAAGCKLHVGFKSMLGDGTCDSACSNASCHYDVTDCMKSVDHWGSCSLDLVNNSQCDPQCDSKAYSYDNFRCVRAP
jgi:hypothetical protein